MTDRHDFRLRPVRIGILSDPQYADRPPNLALHRHYGASLRKLEQAIATFNDAPLGDVIDRGMESFDAIMPVYAKLRHPALFVLGNHDFAVPLGRRASVPGILGMLAPWYDVTLRGLRFIVLDGNDISTFAPTAGDPRLAVAQERLNALRGEGAVQAQDWNGTVGARQRQWLQQRLELARMAGQGVILCCHYPIFPENAHNLWDWRELLDIVLSFDNVLAWFNGHNHAGRYGMADGRHFVTFRGMVDTPATGAHAIVTIGEGRLSIQGFGREPSRDLALTRGFG